MMVLQPTSFRDAHDPAFAHIFTARLRSELDRRGLMVPEARITELIAEDVANYQALKLKAAFLRDLIPIRADLLARSLLAGRPASPALPASPPL